MPLSFPSSPSVNQTYTSGTQTWTWDGFKWNITPTVVTGPPGATGPQGPATSVDTSFPVNICVHLSDETTQLPNTSGGASTRVKFRVPFGFVLNAVRSNLSTADTSSAVTIDCLNGGLSSVFTTKPTIPATATTSVGQTYSLNVAQTSIADDEQLTLQIAAGYTGTTARGLKVWLIGSRTLSSALNVPDPITSFTVTPVDGISYGATPSVNLSWSAPYNGGYPIQSYKIEGKTTSASAWNTFNNTYTTSTSASAATFDGSTSLVAGTSYDYRVFTRNTLGIASSAPIVAVVPRTVPASVSGLLSVPGNGDITLRWDTPANGGAALANYSLEGKTTAASVWNPISTPIVGSSLNAVTLSTFDGSTALTNGTSYDYRIKATNAAGASLVSAFPSVTPAASAGAPVFRGFAYTEKVLSNATGVTLNPTSTATGSGGFTVLPQNGDLLVAVLSCVNGVLDVSAGLAQIAGGSGTWTLFGTYTNGAWSDHVIYTKVFNTGDTLYTINRSGGTLPFLGNMSILAFSNASRIDGVSSSLNNSSGGVATITSPSVTTTGASDMIISYVQYFLSGAGAPTLSGWTPSGTLVRTKQDYLTGGPGSGFNYGFGRQSLSGAVGSTGTRAWALGGNTVAWDSFTIAVR